MKLHAPVELDQRICFLLPKLPLLSIAQPATHQTLFLTGGTIHFSQNRSQKFTPCLHPIHNDYSRIFLGKIYSAKPVSFGSPTAFRQRDTTNRAVEKERGELPKGTFQVPSKDASIRHRSFRITLNALHFPLKPIYNKSLLSIQDHAPCQRARRRIEQNGGNTS